MIRLDPITDKVGSIWVPGHDSWRTGTVVNGGPGHYNSHDVFVEQPFSVGDRVVIMNGAGLKVNRQYTADDSNDVVICDAEAVIATISE